MCGAPPERLSHLIAARQPGGNDLRLHSATISPRFGPESAYHVAFRDSGLGRSAAPAGAIAQRIVPGRGPASPAASHSRSRRAWHADLMSPSPTIRTPTVRVQIVDARDRRFRDRRRDTRSTPTACESSQRSQRPTQRPAGAPSSTSQDGGATTAFSCSRDVHAARGRSPDRRRQSQHAAAASL